MRGSKRFLAVLLALAMSAGLLSAAAFATSFSDVPDSHWASEAIERLVEAEVLSGMGDGTFAPGEQVTRAQFIRMINQSLSLTAKGDEAFEDVAEDAWYADDIAIAAEAGFLSLAGDHGGKADPGGMIDRQTAAA